MHLIETHKWLLGAEPPTSTEDTHDLFQIINSKVYFCIFEMIYFHTVEISGISHLVFQRTQVRCLKYSDRKT